MSSSERALMRRLYTAAATEKDTGRGMSLLLLLVQKKKKKLTASPSYPITLIVQLNFSPSLLFLLLLLFA